MSDSSSVDRWHPSNVEWPERLNFKPGPHLIGVTYMDRIKPCGTAIDMIPAEVYEALYADRGRVLAAARELARSIEARLDEDYRGNPPQLPPAQRAALAAFREVDQ